MLFVSVYYFVYCYSQFQSNKKKSIIHSLPTQIIQLSLSWMKLYRSMNLISSNRKSSLIMIFVVVVNVVVVFVLLVFVLFKILNTTVTVPLIDLHFQSSTIVLVAITTQLPRPSSHSFLRALLFYRYLTMDQYNTFALSQRSTFR